MKKRDYGLICELADEIITEAWEKELYSYVDLLDAGDDGEHHLFHKLVQLDNEISGYSRTVESWLEEFGFMVDGKLGEA